jgi:hypothetical protein
MYNPFSFLRIIMLAPAIEVQVGYTKPDSRLSGFSANPIIPRTKA